VYYTVLGEDRDHRSASAGLRSAARPLRTVVGHAVRLKFTPELEFREDVGQANLDRVASLLRSVESPGAAPGEGSGNER
jgi:ribosome-binding factor A